MAKAARTGLVLLLLGLAAPPAAAQSVEDFYKGRTVRIVDGYPPGGGYGLYANLISRHLSKHLPGHPSIVYSSMPGAGSLTLTNYAYSRADKDGTFIAAPSNSVAFTPLMGRKEARFDAAQFNWLPAPTSETGLLVVWHDAPVNSYEDLTKTEILAGVSPGTSSFYARVLNEALKLKIKLILGYPQMNNSLLAMERGEVQAFPSAFWSSLKANRPELLKDKKIKLLIQYGLEPNPELASVPVARELAPSIEDRQLLDAAMAPLALGRPYLLPPGVPADRVAAMRKAFMDTFHDPDYQADAARMNLDIAKEPKSGEAIAKVIAAVYAAPQAVVDRLRALDAASN
jgi:tripartite-type tricarboxylate transporter receptor subunit TctC